jgi:hypothetical protein
MIQWYVRLKSGNFENGYFDVGNNLDLIMETAKEEFAKDCMAQGFVPLTSEVVLVEQNEI